MYGVMYRHYLLFLVRKSRPTLLRPHGKIPHASAIHPSFLFCSISRTFYFMVFPFPECHINGMLLSITFWRGFLYLAIWI